MCVHGAVVVFLSFRLPYPPMHIKTPVFYCSVLSASTTPSLFYCFYWLVQISLSSITYPLPSTDTMQLTPSFLLILGILFRITLDAYAIPLAPEQRGVLTLPLKRTSMRRDLHPHMVCPLVSCSSEAYCDTTDQLFQMHNARAQRRLSRMTGRAESSANEVNRLTARTPSRIGYSGNGRLKNNGLNLPSTCEFFTFVFTSLSSRCTQRSF
jgi:hypothetical protein